MKKLILKSMKVPPLYTQDGNGRKTKFYARLFHNSAQATWYISEIDMDSNRAFGLASINGHPFEWGYICLDELKSLRMRLGKIRLRIPAVERDTSFSPSFMSEISELQDFQTYMGY